MPVSAGSVWPALGTPPRPVTLPRPSNRTPEPVRSMLRSASNRVLEVVPLMSSDQRSDPAMRRTLFSLAVVVRPPCSGRLTLTEAVSDLKSAFRTMFTTR